MSEKLSDYIQRVQLISGPPWSCPQKSVAAQNVTLAFHQELLHPWLVFCSQAASEWQTAPLQVTTRC